MKQRLTTTFMSAWAILIIIITMMAITSCSSGAQGACYAYQNVELQNK